MTENIFKYCIYILSCSVCWQTKSSRNSKKKNGNKKLISAISAILFYKRQARRLSVNSTRSSFSSCSSKRRLWIVIKRLFTPDVILLNLPARTQKAACAASGRMGVRAGQWSLRNKWSLEKRALNQLSQHFLSRGQKPAAVGSSVFPAARQPAQRSTARSGLKSHCSLLQRFLRKPSETGAQHHAFLLMTRTQCKTQQYLTPDEALFPVAMSSLLHAGSFKLETKQYSLAQDTAEYLSHVALLALSNTTTYIGSEITPALIKICTV